MSRLRAFLVSDWLTVRVQIALGAIFVAAALPKVLDPPAFAHMVWNYELVPPALTNLVALVLPWFELLVGLGLVFGLMRRTSVLAVSGLLVAFVLAIGLNLARGNAIDCGCFDVASAGRTVEERLLDMKVVIARDLGMLLMAAQVLWALRSRPEA